MSDGAEAVSSNLRLRTLFTPPPCAVRQMTLGTRSSIQTRSDLHHHVSVGPTGGSRHWRPTIMSRTRSDDPLTYRVERRG